MNPSAGESAESQSLVDRIDALLPQTQCARCGYPSCRDYAVAVAQRDAGLNRCPPGSTATIRALAKLLEREPLALDPTCGGERPWVVARIDEVVCIGCKLCIDACPVDAILGTAKRMHTVIESECTGCELCLDACPVDCIALEPMPFARAGMRAGAGRAEDAGEDFLRRWMRLRAPLARRRYRNRQYRQLRLAEREARRRRERGNFPGRDADGATKKAVIRDAVERSLERRRGSRRHPT